MSRCHAITKKGTACKAPPLEGEDHCISHAPKEKQASVGFGGAQPGSGRPSAPRAVDVLRERIERDIDRVLDPLWDALAADKGVVISLGGGETTVEHVTDHAIRIAAARELLDRAYGKPKQAVDVTTGDEPLSSSPLVVLDPELREQARALLRRAAGARADQSGGTGAGDE